MNRQDKSARLRSDRFPPEKRSVSFRGGRACRAARTAVVTEPTRPWTRPKRRQLASRPARENVAFWAAAARPLFRPKAAGQVSGRPSRFAGSRTARGGGERSGCFQAASSVTVWLAAARWESGSD